MRQEEVPAQTVEAILTGMAAVGVDVSEIRAAMSLPAAPSEFGERWPQAALSFAWMRAVQTLGRPTAGAEVALGVPFGAFGLVDYLIASADTVGGGIHALIEHFRSLTRQIALVLVETPTAVRLEVRVAPSPMPWIGEDFSMVHTLNQLRGIASAPIPVIEVWTTRALAPDDKLSALIDAPVRYGAEVAALCLDAAAMSLPMRAADPRMHRVMAQLAAALKLGDAPDPLEQAIRARLRAMLLHGDASAARVARTLGMSERTLHRKLRDRRTTWQAVLDGFRCDETKRLLTEGDRSLVEVAHCVGFSEQTAWQRAFRRWTGQTPGRWVREVLGRP